MKSDRNGSLTQGQDWKIGGIKNQSWVCMIKIALELLTFGQCQSLACTVDSTLSLSESTPGGGGMFTLTGWKCEPAIWRN